MNDCAICGHPVTNKDLGTCDECSRLLDECAELKLGTAQDQPETPTGEP